MILPTMEKRMMRILIICALGMSYRPCSGFPVFDYQPSSLREALSASVAEVNSQSLSPYLFRAFKSSLKRVNALDEDTVIMSLQFSIWETTCLRESGEDPSACPFLRGYSVQRADCRSTVQMSGEQVQQVQAHCRWADTSESNSSEELLTRSAVYVSTVDLPLASLSATTVPVITLVTKITPEVVEEIRWFLQTLKDPTSGETIICLVSFLKTLEVNSFTVGHLSSGDEGFLLHTDGLVEG